MSDTMFRWIIVLSLMVMALSLHAMSGMIASVYLERVRVRHVSPVARERDDPDE